MLRFSIPVGAFFIALTPALAEENLIAIDVLLIPDDKMMEVAGEWNARMREQSPEGFELDETHAPHVTLIQRHIAKSDLDAVLEAVERLRAEYPAEDLSMTANGLYHIPTGDDGLAGITIELSQQLRDLQAAVVEALSQFDAGAGDESAYVSDPSGTPFDPLLFKYVETFVPAQTGDNFNPHVTIGLAPQSWLREMESLPFDAFDFGATEIAVYQLGNFGTASLRLD